ncbi:hypothetical protein IEQ34_003001 [Dendrobium chrysotoxum]|uniref:Uncharacterized protein n=1 Tax=Dendrobium chrysotoxum TaxID=161865 RepID=A0AAV7HIS5_DENCH|nr:hypothetical protein IEQ34_003001 [Dendrobium chrysotoxum]
METARQCFASQLEGRLGLQRVAPSGGKETELKYLQLELERQRKQKRPTKGLVHAIEAKIEHRQISFYTGINQTVWHQPNAEFALAHAMELHGVSSGYNVFHISMWIHVCWTCDPLLKVLE